MGGEQSFGRHGRTPCHIGDAKPWFKTQPLVEGMHPRIRPPTLHQYVVAVRGPRVRQRGLNYGVAITPTTKLGMGDNVLQEGMASSSAKQVWGRDKRAGGSNAVAIIGDEDTHALLREGFLPDALGALLRLSDSAYL